MQPELKSVDLDTFIAVNGGMLPVAAVEQVELHEADGIYIRQVSAPSKGTVLNQHAHVWDHLTLVATGRVLLWRDGAFDGEYRAPTTMLIKAGVKHAFVTTVENTVLCCIHNLVHGDKAAILEQMMKE